MAKICFFLDQFPILSETFIIKQMEGLLAEHTIDVVCSKIQMSANINYESHPLNILMPRTHLRWGAADAFIRRNIVKLPYFLKSRIVKCLDIMSTIRLNKYDVIIAHFGYLGLDLAPARALGLLKTPVIIFYHGDDVGVPLKENDLSIYKRQFAGEDYHFTVNKFFADIIQAHGVFSQKIKVQHMGISINDFEFILRQWTRTNLKIISVCRQVEKKGIEFALRAVAQLTQMRPDIVWKYTVVGGGPLIQQSKDLAKILNIEGNVEFLGAQPHQNVKRLLADAHIFLLPSVTAINGDCEGIPVVLMEAMASGLVSVSTYHSGIPELIEDGVTGFLTPERDVSAIASKLEWIADHCAECESIATAAQKHVENEFDNNKLSLKLSDCIQNIIAK